MSVNQLKGLCNFTNKPIIADLKCLFNRHELANAGFDVFRL